TVNGRADVQVQGRQLQVRVPAVLLEEASGAVDVDAELGFLLARGGFDVGAWVGHIRVDAQGAAHLRAHRFGDVGDVLELRLGLDVEVTDFGFDGLADFVIGLADAGVDDLAHGGAGESGA